MERSWSPLPLPPALEENDAIPPKSTFSTTSPHSTSPQLHTTQLNSSQLTFGPSAASILEPLGHPNRPKIALSRLLTPYFSRTCRFSKTFIKPCEKHHFMTPRRSPKRPKIDPRRLQDHLQEHLFSTSFLTSILVALGSHLGLILAPFWAPKTGPS